MKTEKRIEVEVNWKIVAENFICDECKKKVFPKYHDSDVLPDEWCSVEMTADYGWGDYSEEEVHFCSTECMKRYMKDENGYHDYTFTMHGKHVEELFDK